MTNTITLNDDQMARRFQIGLAVSVGVNALAVALAAWSATVKGTTTNLIMTPPEFSLTITEPAVEPIVRKAPTLRPVVVKTVPVRPQPEARRTHRPGRPQPRFVAKAAPATVRPRTATVAERPEPTASPAVALPAAPTTALRVAVAPRTENPAAAVRSVSSPLTAAPVAASVSVPVVGRIASGAPRLQLQNLAPDHQTGTASVAERITMDIVSPQRTGVAAPAALRTASGTVSAVRPTPIASGPAGRVFAVAAVATPGAVERTSSNLARPGAVRGELASLPVGVGQSAGPVSDSVVAASDDRVLKGRLGVVKAAGPAGDARTAESVATTARRDPQVKASSRTSSETVVAEAQRTTLAATPDRAPEAKLATTGRAEGSPGRETRGAEAISESELRLSAELRRRTFAGQVFVEVTVEADGNHDVRLTRGSNDDEIDAAIVRSLRRWRWKPAVRNGEKVRSTHQFRYEVRITD